MTRQTTLTVREGNEARALEIAETFRSEWKLQHYSDMCGAREHGVTFNDTSPRAQFLAYGWYWDVRVVEQEIEP